MSFKRRLKREESDEAVAGLMRCDLHVHSKHSGPADLPVLRHVGRESYSERAVYENIPGHRVSIRTAGLWCYFVFLGGT